MNEEKRWTPNWMATELGHARYLVAILLTCSDEKVRQEAEEWLKHMTSDEPLSVEG